MGSTFGKATWFGTLKIKYRIQIEVELVE